MNPSDLPRRSEPVEAEVVFHRSQVADPAREVRVARLDANGPVVVPSQLCCEVVEDDLRRARLFFLADVPAGGRQTYLILSGNDAAPQPAHDTDLSVAGEGYALTIENGHYRAQLAPSSGNLKSLYPAHGEAAFVGTGPPMTGGHGVEGTIHWDGLERRARRPLPPHQLGRPAAVRLRGRARPGLRARAALGSPDPEPRSGRRAAAR